MRSQADPDDPEGGIPECFGNFLEQQALSDRKLKHAYVSHYTIIYSLKFI